MKLNDRFLDSMGEVYRAMCGMNDVLVHGGLVITFEDFLRMVLRERRRLREAGNGR